MKNGFTLIETIVVIAILGAVSVLIGTNFFGLIGSADEYEKENLYKYLNEAACVYVNSNSFKENKGNTVIIDGTSETYPDCSSNCDLKSKFLVYDGYIDENAGLLRTYSEDEIKSYTIKVNVDTNKERTCCVDYSTLSGVTTDAKGKGAC